MSAPILENPDLIQSLKEPHRGTFDELAAIELISDDGVPMESCWHRKCMCLLVDQIDEHFRGRDDYYVGGNSFIYFSPEQVKTHDFRGPDFFYVRGVSRFPIRDTWTLWDENGQPPTVVVELASPSTRNADFGIKFRIYRDRLRVPEYFVYDPETFELSGWRLQNSKYVPIDEDERGRLPSNELDLTLGTWEGEVVKDVGTWLRFFDREGHVVPTPEEAQEKRAIAERSRADKEMSRADKEKSRADKEKSRADKEKSKAVAAEAENSRLRELLGKLQAGTQNGTANHS